MQAYVDFLLFTVKRSKVEPNDQYRALVKMLGEVGAYAKILKKPEQAVHALEESLKIIDEKNLGMAVWAVHSLRYGDALRFKKDFIGAETAFRSVLELSQRKPEIQHMEDFAWQHLGKLKFDEGELAFAKEYFMKALEIRQKKGIKELIDSTQQALHVIKMRQGSVKKYKP